MKIALNIDFFYLLTFTNVKGSYCNYNKLHIFTVDHEKITNLIMNVCLIVYLSICPSVYILRAKPVRQNLMKLYI